MSWQAKWLTPGAEANGVPCQVVSVHPWTPGAGQRTPSGTWLSPVNATGWLTRSLAAAPVRMDVTAWLITAPDLAAFIRDLAALSALFPLPEISALHRRAVTAAGLAVSRMQIPATPGGLPPVRTLSVTSLRRAASAQSVISAGQTAVPDLAGELAAFREARAGILAAAGEEIAGIGAQALRVYALSVLDDVPGAVRAMREAVPHPDHVFTLCLAFIGQDLSAIRGMLRDEFTA